MIEPTSFRDGEYGYALGALFGGAFDGARYRMPVLPDGEIPVCVSLPLDRPGQTGHLAVYIRHGNEPIGGYYLYIFDGYRDSRGCLVPECLQEDACAGLPATTSMAPTSHLISPGNIS